jgi:hypothetical protein
MQESSPSTPSRTRGSSETVGVSGGDEYNVLQVGTPGDQASRFSSTRSLENDNGPTEEDLELGIPPSSESHGVFSRETSGDDSILDHINQLHGTFSVPEGHTQNSSDRSQRRKSLRIEDGQSTSGEFYVHFNGNVDSSNEATEETGQDDAISCSSEDEKKPETVSQSSPYRNWHRSTKGVGKSIQQMIKGARFSSEQSDEELHASLAGLARCLYLIREYLAHYGMPERGGPRDQEHVLREIIRDLYAGGVPLWALEPVVQKAAEGLTVSNVAVFEDQ